MPVINLETTINAPITRVFDLARSIDLHKTSAIGTNEEAIEGKTSGLIEFGETVTWRAKHLGVYQNLTVKVVEFEKPYEFSDIMLKGAFKSMKHTHRFKENGNATLMLDSFNFESPFGVLGNIANLLFLKNYMKTFLVNKNLVLKNVAEGNEWKKILNNKMG